jgi:hypothetical protein
MCLPFRQCEPPELAQGVDAIELLWWDGTMVAILASALALLVACSFALVFGGRDERQAAGCFSAAAIGSAFPMNDYASVELVILSIDLVLAAFLFWLVFYSKAFWPIWATAFHLVTLATHACLWIQPNILPIAYATFGIAWSYPVLFALMWGTTEEIHFRRTSTKSSG